MFDLNDLKHINDRYGHERGDEYIVNCCRLICQVFKHSPVFRIGGDEFVALLRGEAGKAGITDISQKNGRLIFVMKDLDVQTLLDLCSREEYKGILKAEPGDKPTVSLKIISRSRITDQARKFVRSLEKE
jgi:GGDEF domain-containing protein